MSKTFPVGAIIFLHNMAPAEHVAYKTEAEMVEAFQNAVDQKLEPNRVWPYIEPHRTGLAKKLREIMAAGYDEIYDIHALTPENAHIVLADYSFVITALNPQYK